MIQELRLYRIDKQWAFDDLTYLIWADALHETVCKALSKVTRERKMFPKNGEGVIVKFSDKPFGRCMTLRRLREENDGYWYRWRGIDVWLCGLLFYYFETAPRHLYVQIEYDQHNYPRIGWTRKAWWIVSGLF